MKELDRRAFLKTVVSAAALNVLPTVSEGQEKRFQFLSSEMTQEELRSSKERAVASLAKSIPPLPQLEYLRSYVPHLSQESQMYVPRPEELRDVLAKSEADLQKLALHLSANETGIFIFADHEKDKGHFQRLYTLQKKDDQRVEFLKGYAISLAQNGFGNENDSKKTPLGLHKIISGTQGYFGEVVSGLNKYKNMFNRAKYNKKDHWFVKSFGIAGGSDTAEVVTDEYMIVGPHTSAWRGIRIHGTNRSGSLGQNGEWLSLLGGIRRSGGCIRMSNTDVRDLTLSQYAKVGALVMIHATDAAQNPQKPETHQRPETKKEGSVPTQTQTQRSSETPAARTEHKRPLRWNEPDIPGEVKKEIPARPSVDRKRPQRWNE